jgi:hypothetical protein
LYYILIQLIKMCNIELSKSLFLCCEPAVGAFKSLFPHPRKNCSYVEEKTKQREHLTSQIAKIDRLIKDNSIDETTYTRYKKLLEMNYEKKCEATREKHGFTKSNESNVVI